MRVNQSVKQFKVGELVTNFSNMQILNNNEVLVSGFKGVHIVRIDSDLNISLLESMILDEDWISSTFEQNGMIMSIKLNNSKLTITDRKT